MGNRENNPRKKILICSWLEQKNIAVFKIQLFNPRIWLNDALKGANQSLIFAVFLIYFFKNSFSSWKNRYTFKQATKVFKIVTFL